MRLRVVGCHGGETPKHRTSGFQLRAEATSSAAASSIFIDAGTITSGLTLEEQCAIDGVLISHAHLDHLKDLAMLTDNRAQAGAPPLIVAATEPTLDLLRKHFFNGLLWPDFAKLPSPQTPTILYQTLALERATRVAGFDVTAIAVSHSIECSAFLVRRPGEGSLLYSGDTGPTERLWEVLATEGHDLRALMLEVSFPDTHAWLASVSGHHTPATLSAELAKFARIRDVPTLLYHIKPVFQAEVERALGKLTNPGERIVLRIEDDFAL
ncbi:MAG: MBL fold metallo-hydrolase [Polyangiales bacterium]